MALIDDYKQLLMKMIKMGQVQSIDQLLKNVALLKEDFDAQMCYLMAEVAMMKHLKPVALLWAERGLNMDASFAGNRDLIEQIRGISVVDNEYEFLFPFDYTMMNKTLKIVIFNLEFHVFHYTVERFQETWEAMGHQVFVYDVDHMDESDAQLVNFLQGKLPDLLFAFNNTYWSYFNMGKRFFARGNKIPNVNFMFDHPIFFEDILHCDIENAIATCVDQNHANFINQYYWKNKKALFLPLGGQDLPGYMKKPWRERKIDVLYVGALKFCTEGAVEDRFDKIVFDFMMMNTEYPTEKAIQECFYNLSPEEYKEYFPELSAEKKQSDINDEEMCRILHRYYRSDININTIYRAGAVAQLVDAGIPVSVYGNEEWQQMGYEHPENLHYMGKVSPLECIELMCDTKVVLNSLPWFKNGTHDRVANAMLNGAVAVTDPSEYLMERYVDGEDLLYYHLDQLDRLPAIVSSILKDPQKAEYITENAYRKAMLSETWQNRAIQLLKQVVFSGEE